MVAKTVVVKAVCTGREPVRRNRRRLDRQAGATENRRGHQIGWPAWIETIEGRPAHIQGGSLASNQDDRYRAPANAEPGPAADMLVATTIEGFLAGAERRAFYIARLATRNADDALDIVQDAMLTLVRNYRQRGPQDWPPLFYTVLQSRIRDWQRRNIVRSRWRTWLGNTDPEDESDPLLNVPDPHAVSTDDQIDGRRGVAALETALTQLPARQREAFLLRVWEGLDVADTARAMRCSEGSVKTHLSRAVQALREELKEYGP
jgi:RNA polymerase sigma-70 factor, ECF subfamily